MKTSKLRPIHPGEILREEFMKPLGLSQKALARALNVPPRRINEIARHHSGYRLAAGALPEYHGRIMDGLAGRL